MGAGRAERASLNIIMSRDESKESKRVGVRGGNEKEKEKEKEKEIPEEGEKIWRQDINK